ncbi:hypothetical protein Gorai_024981 [Gossypium raimondii]|uniref:Uncharacterized protein n=1 Tax=Gossypium raimondii TaxID=29730 RepID=A0A7J8P0R8_GOSRA|nr:hypothetical protein [Gossypium raimondii]
MQSLMPSFFDRLKEFLTETICRALCKNPRTLRSNALQRL